MTTDYVFPKNNEKEFIKIAEELNYSGLVFIYNYEKDVKKFEEKINDLKKQTKIDLDYALLVEDKNLNKINKKQKSLFLKNSIKSRFAIEKKKISVILELENQKRKDFMHHRASGLNQVLCKLAKQNNVKIAFSFNLILKNIKKRQDILGRIMQNIVFCRKYKVDTMIASFAQKPYEMRPRKDLLALFFVLGMRGDEGKST